MKGVYQRGQVWWIRYRFNGKLVRQSIGTDRVLAERTMEEVRHRIRDGRHEIKPKDERRTFAEYVPGYLAEKKAEGKRSLGRDVTSFAHLTPVFGSSLLHAITRGEVEAYKKERKTKVSGATVNRELALLRHLFNRAIDDGYTRDNPARRVKMFPEQKNKRRKFVFSEDQLQALVNAAAPHLRPILAIAIGTGLRKSDLLGLRWNQVDIDHNCITLFMQKTEESIELPMLTMVREVLWRLKATAGETPFVFTYRDDKRIGDIKTAVNGALGRAKVDEKGPSLAELGFVFHDLRRTFATMLYNRGEHLTKIQRLLGHQSITTTERYLGVKFEETAAAIKALDTPKLRALIEPVSTKRAQEPIPALEAPEESIN